MSDKGQVGMKNQGKITNTHRCTKKLEAGQTKANLYRTDLYRANLYRANLYRADDAANARG
ncbi:MAG: pentapeptide repeat-containing protein [Leptolyngbyaceae cyanobacterium CRU_2_3]|nr:pentapeptide repeat-containing protein [Leptolyngbyaceae cyanobacterium CRU_2_3]